MIQVEVYFTRDDTAVTDTFQSQHDSSRSIIARDLGLADKRFNLSMIQVEGKVHPCHDGNTKTFQSQHDSSRSRPRL